MSPSLNINVAGFHRLHQLKGLTLFSLLSCRGTAGIAINKTRLNERCRQSAERVVCSFIRQEGAAFIFIINTCNWYAVFFVLTCLQTSGDACQRLYLVCYVFVLTCLQEMLVSDLHELLKLSIDTI